MGPAGEGGSAEGLRAYYKAKIEEAELAVRNKTQNLRRLEAQRNELNAKGAPLGRERARSRSSLLTRRRSATAARRATAAARAGVVRGRGGESDEQDEGARQGASHSQPARLLAARAVRERMRAQMPPFCRAVVARGRRGWRGDMR